MTARMFIVAALSVVAIGCGSSDSAAPDAAPEFGDASFAGLPCDVEFGFAYVLDRFTILPTDQGVDLTGDGVPDNIIGNLRLLANPVLNEGIENGTFIYIASITDWEGPPVRDDATTTVALYAGVDADSPPDPSNNYDGEGRFLVNDRQFDVNCNALGASDGVLSGGVLNSRLRRWRFHVPSISELEFNDVETTFTFSEDMRTFTLVAGGVWDACQISLTSGGDLGSGSFLDQLVNGFELQPDIDLDKDGLEMFIGDGTSVIECVDGDGTRWTDPRCPCDPRMADGYSVALDASGIVANVVGILETL